MNIAQTTGVYELNNEIVIVYAEQEIPDGAIEWIAPTPVVPTAEEIAAEIKAALVTQALTALQETDLVATRCFKASVQFPTEWLAYTTSLRNIVKGTDTTSTTLPVKPAFPTGT